MREKVERKKREAKVKEDAGGRKGGFDGGGESQYYCLR